MGKNINRMHFIPKVYLRKWLKETDFLYCYDYKNQKFEKGSDQKEELGLNSKTFQEHRIYSQEFEKAMSKIENNYNGWLKNISNFCDFITKKNLELEKKEFMNLIEKYDKSIRNIIYFAFVQWIRHKDTEERYILFDFFKETILKENTEYFDLFVAEKLEFKNNIKIYENISDNQDIFHYAFNYIEFNKILKFENLKFQVVIDISEQEEFVTSTNPITPLWKDNNHKPYGIMFPLSPKYILRIVEKEGFLKKEEYLPLGHPFICSGDDVKRMNMTMFLCNSKSKIISGNRKYAENLLKDIKLEIIKKLEEIITENKKILYNEKIKEWHTINIEYGDEI